MIDEQTTVFVMGRTALVFLSDGTLDTAPFRGSHALLAVVAQACAPERGERFSTHEMHFTRLGRRRDWANKHPCAEPHG